MLSGEYRVFQDGRLLESRPNIITDYGRELILKYLAGTVTSFAGAIAVGSAQNAALATDSRLGFEFARSAIELKTPIVNTGELIFSASIDAQLAGIVHEIGLFPYTVGVDGTLGGTLYMTFDEFEGWTGGTYNLAKTRVGNSSYQASTSANNASRVSTTERVFGLFDIKPTDTFSLAYFINDANTNTITVEFHSDASNYYRYTFDPSATAGYYSTTWTKGDFISVGSPSWETIKYVDIVVSATAAGSTIVQLDAMRIDNITSTLDNKLVSRTVLSTPRTKLISSPLDIEYVMRYANG